MRLQNKAAIISGAASGMGASTAKIFTNEGAKVLVTDMLEDEGAAVAAEITAAGGTAQFQRLNPPFPR
jgi:NAD(P)-dependent dehydrogenase (short-subunit alcohol dehydrogenase family)